MRVSPRQLDSIVIFIVLFLLYALTAPHTVTLEDSGEFIMTSYFWGVAHPPGYPLYTLLGKIISLLPISTVAYRIHLISAVFAALGCSILYLCSLKILRDRIISIAVALAYGFSLTFWSQAIVAEVYSLNVFFFITLLYLAIELSEGVNFRLVALFSLCFGLSLANHWPLILLNFPILVVLLWPVRNLIFRFWQPALGFLALGMLPYAIMVWRASGTGEMVFSGPITGPGELFSFIIRKEYMGLEASPTATLWDSFLFFQRFLLQSLREFTYAGAAVIGLGIFAAVRRFPKKLRFIFLWGVLSSSLVLKFFEVNDFEPLNVEAYLVYHLIPYAFLSLLLGSGLLEINKRLPKIASYIAPVVLIMAILGFHFSTNNRQSDDFAFRYAKTVLENLPENAKLFVSAETDAGPIGYARYVEGLRPDVQLYSQFGLLFKNRIFDPVHDTPEAKTSRSKSFFKANQPVYFSTPLFFVEAGSIPGLTATKQGLYTILSAAPVGQAGEKVVQAAREFLDAEIKEPYQGFWRYHAGSIYTYLCATLAHAKVPHEFAGANPFCRLQYAAEKFSSQEFQVADRLLESLMKERQFLNKPEHSQMVNLFGQNRINLINTRSPSPDVRTREYQQVVQVLRHELERFPSCENAVLKTLVALDKQAGISASDIFMQKRFSECQL